MKRKREKETKELAKKRKRNKKELTFLGRIIFVFDRISENIRNSSPVKTKIAKERALIKARCGSDEGYANYAIKLRLLCLIICVMLILTASLGLIFSAGRLGVDDIYYMAKDIGYMNSYSEGGADTLNYTKTQTNADFALYKRGLAVASNSEIKLFNATGRVTLTSGDIYSTPVIATSNKYVMVYDLGAGRFSVYNSFKKLHSFTYDGSIAYASMSNDGAFAVVEKSQDYNSVVHIYDNDCKEINTYSCNEYVIAAEMSDNGKFVAVVAATANNGSMITEITFLKQNKDEIYAQITVNGITPYMCKFISDRRVAVFCSDRVRIYSVKGEMISEFMYPESKLSYISYTDGAVSLMFEDDLLNEKNTLVVINKKGKVIHNGGISGAYTDMQMHGENVFLLTNNGIIKYNYKTKISVFKEIKDSYGQLLVCDKNRVLLCTDSRGIYIDIE
ncbi:MAG: hypothetical protein E7667_00760 [Ruminococcaceae bacterium]|nr:hypothetical protein [Oscillospiraceae bacterium]